MTVERAAIRMVPKPWGSADLRPWSRIGRNDTAIGELWFQHPNKTAPDTALLMKLLFTTQNLSIQVHPDDRYAQSIGLMNGKTEAWYVLSADPGARIALGLTEAISPATLRSAIEDGSIADRVAWFPARPGDIVSVPAGTIHAIGAGLVVAEIQQRSDTTFRLFDYGRKRPLDIENAVAVAHAGPVGHQTARRRLSDARTLLLCTDFFVLEHIDLPPLSHWELHATRETWVLVLAGSIRTGSIGAEIGDALFLEDDHALIEVGAGGARCLLAHVGTQPDPGLLRRIGSQTTEFPPMLLMEALS